MPYISLSHGLGYSDSADLSYINRIESFILEAGFRSVNIVPMPATSNHIKCYYIYTYKKSYILMDFVDCPERQEFLLHVSRFLNDVNFKIPQIIFSSERHKMILVEDLGAVNLRQYLTNSNNYSWEMHEEILSSIKKYHNTDINFYLPNFSPSIHNSHFNAFFNYFLANKIKNKHDLFKAKEDLLEMAENDYSLLNNMPQGFVHGRIALENIIVLNPKHHNEKFGFTGAINGFKGVQLYDYISLLENGHVFISNNIYNNTKEYCLNIFNNVQEIYFNQAWALLSMHCNIQQIGYLAYLKNEDLINLQLKRLNYILQSPYLQKYREWISNYINIEK